MTSPKLRRASFTHFGKGPRKTWVLRLEGEDVVGGTDGEGSGFWVVAARDLVIVDVAGNGEQPQDELAALLVRALISR